MLLAILFVTALVLLPRHVHAQWTKVNASRLVNTYMYDVEFISSTVGHAIGINSSGTFIYRTTDGGSTWTSLKGMGLLPASFEFLDENTGIAGGKGTKCKCMAISRTTDGGATWTLDSIPSADGVVGEIDGYGVNAMSFSDASTGYSVGLNGMILKTIDGGMNWLRQDIGNETDFVSDISSPSPEAAYAVAAPDLSSASYIFYRTINGGATWSRVPDFIDNAAFQEVQFLTPQIGFVGGYTQQNAIIYKTTDGGANWKRTYAGPQGEVIYGIEFENQNVGYAVGSNGIILRTTDGGESWLQEPSGTTEVLPNISIINGTAFVVGSKGSLLRRESEASGVAPDRTGDKSSVLTPNPITTSALVSHPELGASGGSLVFYDFLGRETRRVVVARGTSSLEFSRDNLPAGTYLYRLVTGSEALATGTIVVR